MKHLRIIFNQKEIHWKINLQCITIQIKMWIKQQKPSFSVRPSLTSPPNSTSSPSQQTHSSAYIFDDTYKTKLQKNKFEHNPKFAYFNAVLKMRSKLSAQQHQVYEMIFDPQLQFDENKWKNALLRNKKNQTTAHDWKQAKFLNNESSKEEIVIHESTIPKTYRKSVHEISFQSSKKHKRRQSQLYYDQRPRLDDILAEYRRMSRKDKQKQKNKSFYISRRKKGTQEFQLFNRTGRLLPRQFSQPHNRSKKN